MGAAQQNPGEITGEQLSRLGDVELAKEYARTKGSRDVGEEVMRRVMDYTEECDPEEYFDRPLLSDEGEVLTDNEGRPIPLGRYLPDGVAQHSPKGREIATIGVLKFLVSDHRKPDERKSMANMIKERTLEEQAS